MNEICPYCGEPQRFPLSFMDQMVNCRRCGREFLLCNRPRDQQPPDNRVAEFAQFSVLVLGWILAFVFCCGIPMVFVLYILVARLYGGRVT
jgi:hypothetical protein